MSQYFSYALEDRLDSQSRKRLDFISAMVKLRERKEAIDADNRVNQESQPCQAN